MGLLDKYFQAKKITLDRHLSLSLGPFIGAALLVLIFILGSSLYAHSSRKQEIISDARGAYESLKLAYGSLSEGKIEDAAALFSKSGGEFTEFNSLLNDLSESLKPVEQKQVAAASGLARAGR